jgi:HAD superfamily hydrolase (TIGR01544 family)
MLQAQQNLRSLLIDLERKGCICIPNLDSLIYKVSILKVEGSEKIKVFTDFDQTLTKYWYDRSKNIQVFPTYRVLEESNILPDWYRQGTKSLLDKYHPIEIDPSIDPATKSAHMHDWWSKAHELLLKCHFEAKFLNELVKASKLIMREQSLEWLDLLHKENISVVIVSGGITQIITEIMNQLYPNFDRKKFHIVSNEMIFNEQGKLVGFNDRIIHTMNKRKQLQELEEDFSKSNLIVLGDHLQDAFVAARVYTNVQLKIGFLNRMREGELERYKEAFDLVILDDGSFESVLEILKFITLN